MSVWKSRREPILETIWGGESMEMLNDNMEQDDIHSEKTITYNKG